MLRRAAIGGLLFLAWSQCASPASPANPNDIEFRVRLASDSHTFHIGELIKFEISYFSESEKKYRATYMGYESGITPHVTPSDGVVDLEALRRDDSRLTAMSILSSDGFVDTHPHWEEFKLNHWLRFQKPGHYSVTLTNTRVSRLKSADEGGGFEELTLESDPVEFDIVPPDSSWDAGELDNIQRILSVPDVNGSQQSALQRLAYLDTPAAIQTLLHLYLTNTDSSGYLAVNGLLESSREDQIISSLQSALSDPAANVPEGLPDILATLQVRKDLGSKPEPPSDSDTSEDWKKELDTRTVARDKYLAQANAALLASVSRRTGAIRASAIYNAWETAERQKPENSPPSESLLRLRQSVLDVTNDLNPSQLSGLVGLGWSVLPHDQLLPIILTLTKDGPERNSGFSEGAFRLWCEGWPTECHAAILALATDPHSKIDLTLISLLTESEHPEFDNLLKSKMNDPGMLRGSGQAQLDAASIMHIGSRNIIPAVNSVMDQMIQQHSNSCRIDSYFIAFLFRFDSAVGTKRLTAELMEPKNECIVEVFETLNEVRYSDSLLPSARMAVNSPNPEAAGSAAIFLGMHGQTADADLIWKRLNALWNAWRDRSVELQNPSYDQTPQDQAANLEQSLASALSHATNWTLNPDELDRLRAGCLTARCRDIADDKLSLGL